MCTGFWRAFEACIGDLSDALLLLLLLPLLLLLLLLDVTPLSPVVDGGEK